MRHPEIRQAPSDMALAELVDIDRRAGIVLKQHLPEPGVRPACLCCDASWPCQPVRWAEDWQAERGHLALARRIRRWWSR